MTGRDDATRPARAMSHRDEILSIRDYTRLCGLIYDKAGIRLGTEKKTMLEGRIRRRLKARGMTSYEQYCQYLFRQQGLSEELVPLLDVVTTNKTDFFREPGHFNFLVERTLPAWTEEKRDTRPFVVWSAGCSTGEEPYTLAIVLSEYAATHPGFRFKVLATDISTRVLEQANKGIYPREAAAPIPALLRKKYLMTSRDPDAGLIRIVPELRHLVEFRRLNFMDADYGLAEKVDAIFCRNVIIYFDRTTQEQVLGKLARNLVPRGYLFVGHAETLHEMNLPLVSVAPALYRRTDAPS